MLICTFIGTLFASFLGGFSPFFMKKDNKKVSSFLSSFSLGIIIALLFIELVPHSIEHAESIFSKPIYGYLLILGIILITGILFFFLHELIHKLTHHHEHDYDDKDSCNDHSHVAEINFENKKNLFYSGLIFLISIIIHNIPEGFVLGSVFNTQNNDIPISGIIMSVSLFFHNLVIGYSISSTFKKAGKNMMFSVLVTSINGLVSFLIAIIGYFVSSPFENDLFTSIVFAFSSGAILYVLCVELLPQSFVEYKNKYTFLFIIIGFVIGTFLILL